MAGKGMNTPRGRILSSPSLPFVRQVGWATVWIPIAIANAVGLGMLDQPTSTLHRQFQTAAMLVIVTATLSIWYFRNAPYRFIRWSLAFLSSASVVLLAEGALRVFCGLELLPHPIAYSP